MVQHVASTTLIVLYCLMACYVFGQIVLLLRQRHKPFSYKAIFNWFALAWMLMRALFWILFVSSDTFYEDAGYVFYLLFDTPQCILYMTFATLALFLFKVIKRRSWTIKYRNRFLLLYLLFGVIDVVGTLSFSVAEVNSDAELPGQLQVAGTGILFLLLGATFAVLGFRLQQLTAWEYSRMFVFQPRTISVVSFLLAFVFASRCIFNFLTLSNVVSVDITQDDLTTDSIVLFAYIFWEFFPLCLLLATIASGPIGTTGYQAIPKETLNFGVFGAIDAMEAEEASGVGEVDGDVGGGGVGSLSMAYDHAQPLSPELGGGGGGGAGLMTASAAGGGGALAYSTAQQLPAAAALGGGAGLGPAPTGFAMSGDISRAMAAGAMGSAGVAGGGMGTPGGLGFGASLGGAALQGPGSFGAATLSGGSVSLAGGGMRHSGSYSTPQGAAFGSAAAVGSVGGFGSPGGLMSGPSSLTASAPAFGHHHGSGARGGATGPGSYVDTAGGSMFGGGGGSDAAASAAAAAGGGGGGLQRMGAAGFASAQQNALRRSAYIAPQFQAAGAGGAGASPRVGSLGAANPQLFARSGMLPQQQAAGAASLLYGGGAPLPPMAPSFSSSSGGGGGTPLSGYMHEELAPTPPGGGARR